MADLCSVLSCVGSQAFGQAFLEGCGPHQSCLISRTKKTCARPKCFRQNFVAFKSNLFSLNWPLGRFSQQVAMSMVRPCCTPFCKILRVPLITPIYKYWKSNRSITKKIPWGRKLVSEFAIIALKWSEIAVNHLAVRWVSRGRVHSCGCCR